MEISSNIAQIKMSYKYYTDMKTSYKYNIDIQISYKYCRSASPRTGLVVPAAPALPADSMVIIIIINNSNNNKK